VRRTVRGDDPAVILDIGDPVPDPLAEKIRQTPACFLENYLRSARVPKFCPRRQVDVEIADRLRDEPDLQSNRSSLDLTPQTEVAYDPGDLRASVIARNGEVHRGKRRII
jgi:hypothetical protein